MTMKLRQIYTLCLTLVCFVALHHCVLEQIGSLYRSTKSAQDAASRDLPSTPTSCPAHSGEDSTSHGQGHICGSTLQTLSSVELPAPTFVLVPEAFELVALKINAVDFLTTSGNNRFQFDNESSYVVTRFAQSLSIAPNAPPVTLA